jgi:hypothetical protein
MYFVHLIVELRNFKLTLAFEKVEIFDDFLYVEIKYLRKMEKHFIRAKNRLLQGIVKLNGKYFYYDGYSPYWISSPSKSVKIYHQTFYRLVGNIYYRLNEPVRGIFIFSRKLEELFCMRILNYGKTKNFKVILRLK